MRIKKPRFIVTFPTTTGAIGFETMCHREELPGRLIPVPREISAGCGMCWAAPPEAKEALEAVILERGIVTDGVYEIEI